MDGATEAVVHAFNIDALHERQRRQGRQVTLEQQLKFMRFMRAEWAKSGVKPEAVHTATAIIASLDRVAKFTRKR